MPKKQTWMPVFVVTPARLTMSAAHPSHKYKLPKESAREGQDFEQRIGTALRQKDGSLAVQLTALPVDGRLLIRPPRDGECQDPTREEA